MAHKLPNLMINVQSLEEQQAPQEELVRHQSDGVTICPTKLEQFPSQNQTIDCGASIGSGNFAAHVPQIQISLSSMLQDPIHNSTKRAKRQKSKFYQAQDFGLSGESRESDSSSTDMQNYMNTSTITFGAKDQDSARDSFRFNEYNLGKDIHLDKLRQTLKKNSMSCFSTGSFGNCPSNRQSANLASPQIQIDSSVFDTPVIQNVFTEPKIIVGLGAIQNSLAGLSDDPLLDQKPNELREHRFSNRLGSKESHTISIPQFQFELNALTSSNEGMNVLMSSGNGFQNQQTVSQPNLIERQESEITFDDQTSRLVKIASIASSLEQNVEEMQTLVETTIPEASKAMNFVVEVFGVPYRNWPEDTIQIVSFIKTNIKLFSQPQFISSISPSRFNGLADVLQQPDFLPKVRAESKTLAQLLQIADLIRQVKEEEESQSVLKPPVIEFDETPIMDKIQIDVSTPYLSFNPKEMSLPFTIDPFQSLPAYSEQRVQRISSEHLESVSSVDDVDYMPDTDGRIYSPKQNVIKIAPNNELVETPADNLNSGEIVVPVAESQQMKVNRRMEVDELNLRGLSSSEESEPVKQPQRRVRKPFNSFKEDKDNEGQLHMPVARLATKGSTSRSKREFFHESRDYSPRRSPKVSKSTLHEFLLPSLQASKSQLGSRPNHIENFKDMKHRYLHFNTHIQALNRIETLVNENHQLQKLLISSQHDLRLLQRFTKNYFKSMDVLKLNELQNDLQTQQVLRQCFQETPVVLLAFASPLVRKIEDEMINRHYITEMPLLDYEKEFAGALQGMQETRMHIKVAQVQATVEKLFRFCNDQSPLGIHFSGHGVANEISMNGANCLVLETEDGCAHYLTEDQLIKLIKDLNTSLKFVFLASCHSELPGFLFHFAGVQHVICVKQDAEIYDKAAITMAKLFYNFLFTEQNSVCKAFERAKLYLSSNSDKKISREAAKFIMIKESDDVSDRLPKSFFEAYNLGVGIQRANIHRTKKSHECQPLGPFQQGKVEIMDKKHELANNVPAPGDIVGRQIDIQAIVDLLKHNTPLVLVHGLVGIGKSAVVKKVGIFFSQRQIFKDGVLYVSMRDREFVNILNYKMHALICSTKNEKSLELMRIRSFQDSAASSQNEIFEENLEENKVSDNISVLPTLKEDFRKIVDQQKFNSIQHSLINKECLIIIDNTEDLLQNDEEQTSKFIETLLKNCTGIKILMTGHKQLMRKVPGIMFYQLGPLSNKSSLELLQLKSGHVITQPEIKELLQKTVHGRNQVGKPKVQRLEDHNLCTILSGHQGSITLLAPLYQNRSLFEFYKVLLKMYEEPGLLSDISQINSENTLQISLMATANHLQKSNPTCIEMFSLIGLMPSGVYDGDINRLWGNEKWFVVVEILISMSLVQVSVENEPGEHEGQRKYRLMQFMNKFATGLLNLQKLREFHDRICQLLSKKFSYYFMNYCVESGREFQTQHQKEVLDEEPNVWACINRLFELNTVNGDTSKWDGRIKGRYLTFGAGLSDTDTINKSIGAKSNIDFQDVSDTCDDQVLQLSRQNMTRITKNAIDTKSVLSKSQLQQELQMTMNSGSNERSANQTSKSQITDPSIHGGFKLAGKVHESRILPRTGYSPPMTIASLSQALQAIPTTTIKTCETPTLPKPKKVKIEKLGHFEDQHQIRTEWRVSHQLSQIHKSCKHMRENPKPKNSNHQLKSASNDGDVNHETLINSLNVSVAPSSIGRERSLTLRINARSRQLSQSDLIPNQSDHQNEMILPTYESSSTHAKTFKTYENPQDNVEQYHRPQPAQSQTQINDSFLMCYPYPNQEENNSEQLQEIEQPLQSSQKNEGSQIRSVAHSSDDGFKFSATNFEPETIFQDADSSFPGMSNYKKSAIDLLLAMQNENDDRTLSALELSNNNKSDENLTNVKNTRTHAQFGNVSLALGGHLTRETLNGGGVYSLVGKGRRQSMSSKFEGLQERDFGQMTKEQNLIITYISLLVLQTRHQFALRTINLIGQQLAHKLLFHANLTRLYGLCLLIFQSERIKEAFELFRRAKKQFKLINGSNNKLNLGLAQLYMIEATLLRTRSERIFAPNTPSEHSVMKKAQKRFEAAKQIYKNREHLAGQQFCCQELLHIHKVLGQKNKSVENELKEVQQKLKTAYTNDNRLFCGSSHVFVLRTEGLELSLMIEIMDADDIVQPKPKLGLKHVKANNKQVNNQIQKSKSNLTQDQPDSQPDSQSSADIFFVKKGVNKESNEEQSRMNLTPILTDPTESTQF